MSSKNVLSEVELRGIVGGDRAADRRDWLSLTDPLVLFAGDGSDEEREHDEHDAVPIVQ